MLFDQVSYSLSGGSASSTKPARWRFWKLSTRARFGLGERPRRVSRSSIFRGVLRTICSNGESNVPIHPQVPSCLRTGQVGSWIRGFLDTDNYRTRVLHKLARSLNLPKLPFQVIRRTVATLAQKKGPVKDVQGVLRHSRTATTTDIYMQEIAEGVRGTIDSIHRELTKSPKPNGTGSGSKRATSRPIEKKTESGGGKARVSGRRTLQERRSKRFQNPSQKGFENLPPNAAKPGESVPLSCWVNWWT
jgi:hypothetical protein